MKAGKSAQWRRLVAVGVMFSIQPGCEAASYLSWWPVVAYWLSLGWRNIGLSAAGVSGIA